MEAFVLIFVVIGALFAIASGIWVAVALVRAISRHQPPSTTGFQMDETNSKLQKESPNLNQEQQ